MPETTAKRKIEQIIFYGERCHFVSDPCQMYAESERMDRELNGHFMDQFTYAERLQTGMVITILPTVFFSK
ncbi:cysteine synthase/cystathionine beta-synthase [Erwinia tracheiphila PSU-1]|nr:cysteine synthase/cystathionine beta-synthase [Erwinia tracheiphila PSU-1]